MAIIRRPMNPSNNPPIFNPQQQYLQQPQAPVQQAPVQQQPGNAEYVHAGYFRQSLGALKQVLEDRLLDMERKLAGGEAKIEQLISFKTNPALAGLGQADPSCVQQFGDAIKTGRVAPFIFVIDIPVDAGTVGEKLVGQNIPTGDGPFCICSLHGYAQIDSASTDAKNFPWSLVPKPSCNEECGTGAFSEEDATATLELDFGNELIAGVDVSGSFIPISQRGVRFVTYGREVICATLHCPDDVTRNFSATVPLVMWDHPDYMAGLVGVQVNSAYWQNVEYPLDWWDLDWSLTDHNPANLPFGGYLDCQKIMSISFTPTHAPRFDTLLTFVLAGYRIITCGPNACGG